MSRFAPPGRVGVGGRGVELAEGAGGGVSGGMSTPGGAVSVGLGVGVGGGVTIGSGVGGGRRTVGAGVGDGEGVGRGDGVAVACAVAAPTIR